MGLKIMFLDFIIIYLFLWFWNYFISLELLFCASTLLILFSVNLFSVYLLVASGNSHLIFTFTKCLFINFRIPKISFYDNKFITLRILDSTFYKFTFTNFTLLNLHYLFSISTFISFLFRIFSLIFLLSHIWIFGYLVLYFCNFRFIIISFHILLFNI